MAKNIGIFSEFSTRRFINRFLNLLISSMLETSKIVIFPKQNAYFYKQIDNYIVHDSIIDYFILSKKYKQDRSLFNNQNKERKQLFVQEVLTKLNNVVIITNCGEKSTYAKCKETINHIAIKKNTLVGAVLYDTDRDIYCKYDE